VSQTRRKRKERGAAEAIADVHNALNLPEVVEALAGEALAAERESQLAETQEAEQEALIAATQETETRPDNAFQLKRVVEGLIFASDRPLTVPNLRQYLGSDVGRKEIQESLDALVEEYSQRGIVLHDVGGGYQFRTHPSSSEWIQKLIAGRPVRLSRAQLDTLAIIAYRQPITRPEIDDIRGVDSASTVKVLLDRSMVRILGKKEEVGRPLLYGTSKEFLEFFNLAELRDLPTLREFHELNDEGMAQVDKLGADISGVDVGAVAAQVAKEREEEAIAEAARVEAEIEERRLAKEAEKEKKAAERAQKKYDKDAPLVMPLSFAEAAEAADAAAAVAAEAEAANDETDIADASDDAAPIADAANDVEANFGDEAAPIADAADDVDVAEAGDGSLESDLAAPDAADDVDVSEAGDGSPEGDVPDVADGVVVADGLDALDDVDVAEIDSEAAPIAEVADDSLEAAPIADAEDDANVAEAADDSAEVDFGEVADGVEVADGLDVADDFEEAVAKAEAADDSDEVADRAEVDSEVAAEPAASVDSFEEEAESAFATDVDEDLDAGDSADSESEEIDAPAFATEPEPEPEVIDSGSAEFFAEPEDVAVELAPEPEEVDSSSANGDEAIAAQMEQADPEESAGEPLLSALDDPARTYVSYDEDVQESEPNHASAALASDFPAEMASDELAEPRDELEASPGSEDEQVSYEDSEMASSGSEEEQVSYEAVDDSPETDDHAENEDDAMTPESGNEEEDEDIIGEATFVEVGPSEPDTLTEDTEAEISDLAALAASDHVVENTIPDQPSAMSEGFDPGATLVNAEAPMPDVTLVDRQPAPEADSDFDVEHETRTDVGDFVGEDTSLTPENADPLSPAPIESHPDLDLDDLPSDKETE
tara:strand:- start:10776 stop:13436 length:2661 start_codon:yes stop_codon:yes gene_type:complete